MKQLNISGESADIWGETADSWKEMLPEIIKGYMCERKHMEQDEPGVFWQALTDCSFEQKRRTVFWRQKKKEMGQWLSLLLQQVPKRNQF